MLYGYGLRLGVELLLKGRYKESVRYLVIPVNYWRNLEYELVYREGRFQSGEKVLDIGSPKLLSLYLAEVIGARVSSTDIEAYFVNEYRLIREMRGIPSDMLHIKVEDGRNLSFGNGSFDKVYSLSVVEHIPDNGDTECLKEIGRVLSQDGRCVITVPFAPKSEVEYRDPKFYWARPSVPSRNGKVFYQRRYSEEDLYSRLIGPSRLNLVKLGYFGEKVNIGPGREVSQFLPRPTGPIQPILSKLLHTKVAASWKDLRKPLGALIVLGK